MNLFKEIYIRTCSPAKRADYYRREGLNIGERCSVGHGVSFGSEPYLIAIGDHVRINEGVKFDTHDGGVWVLRELAKYNENKCRGITQIPEEIKQADLFGKIVVGSNVHIGTNAFIMPGVKIGNNCIIGVGAIVTKDIPDNSVAVGVPARVIETIQEYYKKHEKEFVYTKGMSKKEKKEFLVKSMRGGF